MQNKFTKVASAMGLAGMFLLTSTATYANNTITFTGEVTDQTCSVTVNDNVSNSVVLLESVSAAELANAGDTAGQRMFTIGLTGCTAPGADTQLKTKFVGNNVTAAGNLGNTGDAANVAAGQRMFTIGLTGCTAPGADTQLKTKFVGNNVTAAGNLGNTGDAANVALQILDNSLQAVDLTSEASLGGLVLLSGATSATTEYGVQYISELGGATAGSVSGSLQYAISYN
ncbi:fimbrial protein [Salinivibrio sp. IB872]|uniref:fimbrial protein n=1 Tax=Salinivibrio sp. IB872 TaxID=1766123 RepID=UPI000987BDDA|nr:fimbrial protein [Salinivibrio sp. IB872]OOF24163.1 hypothetical protein BZJ18_13590 [Salinivibrio sp. IB872]